MKNSSSKKGFTVVELVIVIAVIAVLAAVLIPTFSSLIKKANDSAYLQERTNQQIADLAEKVENQDFLSWADLEAKLAEELAKIEIPAGVTSEEVKTEVTKAVTSAFAEHLRADTNNNTALTEAQVKAIVEKALEGQLTTAQVEAIVKEATASIKIGENNLTADQVKSIVDAAVANLNKETGITTEEMETAIKNAIAAQPGLEAADVSSIINNALAGFGHGYDLTASEVKQIIENAMGNIDVTADQLAVDEMNVILANVQATKDLIVADNDAQTSINIFNTLIANGYNDEIDAYHQGHGFGYVVEGGKAAIVLIDENDAATYPTNYAGKAYKLFFEAVDDAEELESAFETGYVLLKKDAVFENSISISNDLTLVSNSKILSDTDISFDSAANSIVNVTGANEEITVNMSGVTLAKERHQTYNRGLSIGNNNKKVTIVLDNVNIEAYYYAINITASNPEGVELVVKNSTINGWAALNIWSKSNITFENCNLISTARSTENFGTIVLNSASDGSKAAGSNLTFKNCTIEANNVAADSGMTMVSVRCDATLTFEGCTYKVNGTTVSEPITYVKDGVNATIEVK